MMNDEEPQQKKTRVGVTGKGFVKGDPRINRLGRPKHFDQFRKLAQRISHEKVIAADGNTITRVEMILRQWAWSKQPALQLAFVQYAYGKPPEKIETTGLENKPVLILHYGHERPERDPAVAARILPDSASNGEGTRRPLLSDAE